MNILLVEDNYEKVNRIHAIFDGKKKPEIVSARSSSEAYSLMKQFQYDIVILDVQIPDIEGGDVSISGGTDFLYKIAVYDDIYMPYFVMGLTSHCDGFDTVKDLFMAHGWPLFNFESEYKVWSDLLVSKVDCMSKKSNGISVDVAIVTALEHTELEAVLDIDCSWSAVVIGGLKFNIGSLALDSGRTISLAAISSDRMGSSAASFITTKTGLLFKPNLMVMVGICAGVKGKVDLGDIVVAECVWDWSAGKIVEDKENSTEKFLPEPHQISLSRNLKNKIKLYASNEANLTSIYKDWEGERGSTPPKVHLAPMACGSQVVANQSIIDKVLEGNRKMLALEMESYGFMNACESMEIDSFVAKSVCDYADSEKNDAVHNYAAYTSAKFVIDFLKRSYGN
ncbi:response regulator [Halobacteriovorax sp.]|uniref:phosphorylase family protein n=1 Tax=Halobacteriovorax sp. TaxID=2020862 RepID=UPI003AF2C0F5